MKQNLETPVVVATATLAACFLAGALWWTQKKGKAYYNVNISDVEIPTKWAQVGELGELLFYPLKAGKRQSIPEAECTKIGLCVPQGPGKVPLQDRSFVMYNNETNEFLSIKKNTKGLVIETYSEDDTHVRFTSPGSEDLVVKIPTIEETPGMSHIQIYFGEKVKTVDCGTAAAEWFSQRLLGKLEGLRLGCFIESVAARNMHPAYTKHADGYIKFHSDYMGAFHNIASFLMLSEASVADLNSRIAHHRSPVTAHYFRPNFIIKGTPAYSEHTWDWIKIGDQVVLRAFKECNRCIITTIDPETGARDPKMEPYKTLKTTDSTSRYTQVQHPKKRAVDGSDPVMGHYAGCHRAGIIRVGDPVYVA